MIGIGLITSAIKAASNAFQKLGERERLAALAQSQFLDDAATDLCELTEEYKKTGDLEPYWVSQSSASMNAAASFIEIDDVKAQTKSAIALVGQAYKAQCSGTSKVLSHDDVRKLRELAGELKGVSRIMRGVAEANKPSGGWF